MFVRLSARDNSASSGRIIMKFGIWVFFKSVLKFQVSLKSDKTNGVLYVQTYVQLW